MGDEMRLPLLSYTTGVMAISPKEIMLAVDKLKKAFPDMKYLYPVLMNAPTLLQIILGLV